MSFSLSSSAALSVYVSSKHWRSFWPHELSPNPFLFDYVTWIWRIGCQVHPDMNIDVRSSAYLAFVTYRLVRHLIPAHDAVVTTAGISGDQPPDSPPDIDVVSKLMEARMGDVLVGAVQRCALVEKNKAFSRGLRLQFVGGAHNDIGRVLSIDDQSTLSSLQRWITDNTPWRVAVAAVCEYVMAELLEQSGNIASAYWRRASCDNTAIIIPEFLHTVVESDDELRHTWSVLGMPEYCPPQAYVSVYPQYKQELQQKIGEAVSISAAWLTDSSAIAQRVAEYESGALESGDPLFFQRFHIRPLAHLGTRLEFDRSDYEESDGCCEAIGYHYISSATFDMIDAANVSWPCIVSVRVWHQVGHAVRNSRLNLVYGLQCAIR